MAGSVVVGMKLPKYQPKAELETGVDIPTAAEPVKRLCAPLS